MKFDIKFGQNNFDSLVCIYFYNENYKYQLNFGIKKKCWLWGRDLYYLEDIHNSFGCGPLFHFIRTEYV